MLRDLLNFVAQLPLGVPQIVRYLHTQPEPGAVAAKPPKAQRHLRRDSRAFGEDRMQHLPGDAELTRRLGNAEVERREYVLAQDRAGVDGLHLGGLLG